MSKYWLSKPASIMVSCGEMVRSTGRALKS